MELWQRASGYLRGVLNPDVFSRWIETIHPASVQGNCFVLNVDNDFYQDWLEKNYKGFIMDALTVAGAPEGLTVRFAVAASGAPPPPPPRAEPPAKKTHPKKAGAMLASPLNPTFTFENFVTGPSNSFAHAAAIGVSQAPGRAYNPLFIHGQTGIGKTHLMQAVGHRILQSPGMSICYVSSETLLNEYIEALKNRTIVDFRNRYRRTDVLLVDDIQFLGGKDSIQEEFFHTFNALFDAHKQIIMTSDLPPKSLKGLEPRLVSRFEWGMVTEIESPDFETRLAILRYKNSLAKVQLNDEALTFIAYNIKSNVRSLEGALTRTVAFASLNNTLVITVDILKALLKDQLNEERQKDITCGEIMRATANCFDLRMTDMSSKKRTRMIATPRQVAMFLCRKLTRSSLPEIAQAFGKTHGTA
ncbi:MAG: chromosomal replication initiator protein DnaA, partial [Kiritimatiellaeota bacterium]|nr:chromosomal replication initiator protein DnaA [Kiritimatiellota bacterium]